MHNFTINSQKLLPSELQILDELPMNSRSIGIRFTRASEEATSEKTGR
jgi:hypothetical protein